MALKRKIDVACHFFLIFAVSAFFASSPPLLASVSLPSEEQLSLSIKGGDLLLSRDYAGAERFLKDLVKRHPEELLGTFGLMVLYQIRNLENYDFRFDPSYRLWEGKGRQMAQRVLRDPASDPWDLLITGGTLGISGFYRAHNSRWFAALRDCMNAALAFRRSYEKDSRRTEALFGIGLYDYWRSHFTRRLRFLPFFPDRRREGRAKLLEAREKSPFVSVFADTALAFIDFQDKNYEEVLLATGRLLKKYPTNTILMMLQGQALLAMKRYEEARTIFEEILRIDPAIKKSYLFLGLAWAEEGKNPSLAGVLLRKYLEREPDAPSSWKNLARERLKHLTF